MPKITLADDTRRLIRDQARGPLTALSDAVRLRDGLWEVPIDDEVAAVIEAARLPAETDDEVVSRLVRGAIGTKPN
jgi:hypothetical protein